MAGITLRTARQVVPMIYAYTTPEIARHNGCRRPLPDQH